jgi:Mrp family chromosome partitioning ATPase
MVLIDAPPLFLSSDAELIASCAQGVILVVEAGKVVSGEVKRAMDIVREIGPLMIEVVVNRVRDFRGHGYYSELVEQYESAGRPRPSA